MWDQCRPLVPYVYFFLTGLGLNAGCFGSGQLTGLGATAPAVSTGGLLGGSSGMYNNRYLRIMKEVFQNE